MLVQNFVAVGRPTGMVRPGADVTKLLFVADGNVGKIHVVPNVSLMI